MLWKVADSLFGQEPFFQHERKIREGKECSPGLTEDLKSLCMENNTKK